MPRENCSLSIGHRHRRAKEPTARPKDPRHKNRVEATNVPPWARCLGAFRRVSNAGTPACAGSTWPMAVWLLHSREWLCHGCKLSGVAHTSPGRRAKGGLAKIAALRLEHLIRWGSRFERQRFPCLHCNALVSPLRRTAVRIEPTRRKAHAGREFRR